MFAVVVVAVIVSGHCDHHETPVPELEGIGSEGGAHGEGHESCRMTEQEITEEEVIAALAEEVEAEEALIAVLLAGVLIVFVEV